MKTYDLQGRERPLRIVGPPGLPACSRPSTGSSAGSPTRSSWSSSTRATAIRHEGYEVRCFQVEHQVRAHGYALVEDQRPGRFDPVLAASLGVEPGPDFGRLQSGEAVRGETARFAPSR